MDHLARWPTVLTDTCLKNTCRIKIKAARSPAIIPTGLWKTACTTSGWGTDKGLSRYDIKADTFTNFPAIPGASANAGIIPFWATKNLLYCIEGTNITTYNVYSFVKKTVANLMPSDVPYNAWLTSSIYDPFSKSVWLLVPTGGLLQISLVNQKRSYYTWNCFLNRQQHNHASEAMRYDPRRASIWINSPDGLLEFILREKRFHAVEVSKKIATSKKYYREIAIDLDAKGRVYLAPSPTGLLVYDPATQTVQTPFSNDSAFAHEVFDANVNLYCDRDDMIWAASWARKGIYQLMAYKPAAYRYILPAFQNDHITAVHNMITADQGKLWVYNDSGLQVLDPAIGSLNAFPATNRFSVIPQKSIPLLYDTLHLKAWLVIDTSIVVYDTGFPTLRCQKVTLADAENKPIAHPRIQAVSAKPYKSGCVFIASERHQLFAACSDSLIARPMPGLPDAIDYFALANDDMVFLKSSVSGYATYFNSNGTWKKTASPLDSVLWRFIIYNNADETFWTEAPGQLLQYDKHLRLLHRYTRKEGFTPVTDVDIILDDDGNLWFASAEGTIGQLIRATVRFVNCRRQMAIGNKAFGSVHPM